MYGYIWDKRTHGYRLTTQNAKHVATEVRPVFAEELKLLGFDSHFSFDTTEKRPLLWCKNNIYFYNGEEVAAVHKLCYGKPVEATFSAEHLKLHPVDIAGMVEQNRAVLDLLVADTSRRIKEMYEEYKDSQNVIYIAFSGGKDSMLLLDLCDKVLPKHCPVVFSDTTMELPDSYQVWEQVQSIYPDRKFLRFTAERSALENWHLFGPPSRSLDWCCAVHKSAPAVVSLKQYFGLETLRTLAFLGIRREESLTRNEYQGDIAVGVKNASQVNAMPILEWGAHELYLYAFANRLSFHRAYRFGLPRVGCLLCPKASEKYIWIKNKLYPNEMKDYTDTIINSTSKSFSTKEEQDDYIASGSWQARRNGLELRERISSLSESSTASTSTWSNLECSRALFLEWLKTIGPIEDLGAGRYRVVYRLDAKTSCSCELTLEGDEKQLKTVVCNYDVRNATEKNRLRTHLSRVLCKASACVGCRVCEAECSFGALHITTQSVKIETERCVHCLKCHDLDYGCWRYHSMMSPLSTDTPLKSIANYQTFGLRPAWLEVYASEGEKFPDTGMLGPNMITSARIWFRQSYLCADTKSLAPGKLLELVKNNGAEDDFLWSLIWIALANNSPLVKWFVTTVPFEQETGHDELLEMLGGIVSVSTRRNGLQALKDLLRQSPLSLGEKPVARLAFKGLRCISITRVRRSIEPLALLYSLYVIAQVSGRTSFTISEMMNTDFEAKYISPLVVFGMSVEELKGQCLGIASKYPRLLNCNFTLGLDEVRVFPQERTRDDVLALILGE